MRPSKRKDPLMKKINRRDYLKSLGATAGVIAGAAKLDVFAQRHQTASTLSSSSPKHREDTSKIFVETAVNQFDLTPNESVKLVFYGLMAMWRSPEGHCLVGFHSKPSTKHQHRLMIKAFRKGANGVCEQMGTTEMVPPGADLDLEITLPDVLNGAYFFQPP